MKRKYKKHNKCKKSANERLLDIMKKSSDEAKKNGFRSRMLDEILNNE